MGRQWGIKLVERNKFTSPNFLFLGGFKVFLARGDLKGVKNLYRFK
jgi:hypothetical protein